MAPMKFRLTSPYGVLEEIRDGRVHTGIDLAMPEGTTLRSVAEGVVERVVDYGTENIGKGVVIRTDDGTRLIYGHMSKVDVKQGEHIDAGEYIGLSGNTGHSSGPHLHFGMKHNGEWIDPTPLAGTISNISGGPVRAWWDVKGKIADQVQEALDNAKDEAIETAKEHIFTWLHAAGEIALDLSSSVTLIGTALLIILRVVGLQQGYRWAGILVTVNALLRLLLGGALR